MRTTLKLAATGILTAILLSLVGVSAAQASMQSDNLSDVNAYRASQGRAALAYDGTLSNAAQSWANQMVDQVHMVHSGYSRAGWITAENIAFGAGSDSPDVVAGWAASAAHNANMLGSQYQFAGVGYNPNGGWVLILGAPVPVAPPAPAPVVTPNPPPAAAPVQNHDPVAAVPVTSAPATAAPVTSAPAASAPTSSAGNGAHSALPVAAAGTTVVQSVAGAPGIKATYSFSAPAQSVSGSSNKSGSRGTSYSASTPMIATFDLTVSVPAPENIRSTATFGIFLPDYVEQMDHLALYRTPKFTTYLDAYLKIDQKLRDRVYSREPIYMVEIIAGSEL